MTEPTATVIDPARQWRGRLTLLAIAAAFALPIAAAMYLYFSDHGWRPGGKTQHGELIVPARTLPDWPLTDASPPQQFREVWSLVVPAGRDCSPACADALDKIYKVRLWLGPKMTRTQLVFVPETPVALQAELAAEYPQLIVPRPELLGEIQPVIGAFSDGDIFLVDPFGNLMMRYPAGTDMGDIRKDLGHLLQLSTIG